MATITSIVPAARIKELVTNEVDGEVLVYDQATHHIHHLNETSAAVWRLCDGQRTLAEVARAAGIRPETVQVALGKLADASLLRDELALDLRAPAQSRRAFMKKAAIAGAIPAIVSVTAPLAAQAASRTVRVDGCGIGGNNTCANVSICCINACGTFANVQGASADSCTADPDGSGYTAVGITCTCFS